MEVHNLYSDTDRTSIGWESGEREAQLPEKYKESVSIESCFFYALPSLTLECAKLSLETDTDVLPVPAADHLEHGPALRPQLRAGLDLAQLLQHPQVRGHATTLGAARLKTLLNWPVNLKDNDFLMQMFLFPESQSLTNIDLENWKELHIEI